MANQLISAIYYNPKSQKWQFTTLANMTAAMTAIKMFRDCGVTRWSIMRDSDGVTIASGRGE